jgi:flagellar basal body-associated protein FliL
MAEEEKTETEVVADSEEQQQPMGRKKGLALGGGIVGLIASAYIVSMVALPGAPDTAPFEGPFITGLSEADIQVNLKGDGGRRYMVMTLQAEYDAYEEAYVKTRVADLVYQAKLSDILISLGRQKTKEDISDRIGEESFKAEIQEAVETLVFPVHVGNPTDFNKEHEESGLAPGYSIGMSTMLGGFRLHTLHVNAPKGTIKLDEGPTLPFDGHETDLPVADAEGRVVYVDVTRVKEDFVGEVPVGRFGQIRSILFGKFLVQ